VVRRPPLPELTLLPYPEIQVGRGLAQLTRPQHCLVCALVFHRGSNVTSRAATCIALSCREQPCMSPCAPQVRRAEPCMLAPSRVIELPSRDTSSRVAALTASIMGEILKCILVRKLALVEAMYAAPFARSLLRRFLFGHLPQNRPSGLVDFQVRRPQYE